MLVVQVCQETSEYICRKKEKILNKERESNVSNTTVKIHTYQKCKEEDRNITSHISHCKLYVKYTVRMDKALYVGGKHEQTNEFAISATS